MKKIFIICSKKFYKNIPEIKKTIEKNFEIYLPNCYDDPSTEARYRDIGQEYIKNLKLKCLNKVKN